jgi:hypothetical protein
MESLLAETGLPPEQTKRYADLVKESQFCFEGEEDGWKEMADKL